MLQPSGPIINSFPESARPGLQDSVWQFDCVLNKWLKPSMVVGEPLQRSSHRSVAWGDQVPTCRCCMAHNVEHSLQLPHSADCRLEFAACSQRSSKVVITPTPTAELLRCSQFMLPGTTFLFMSAQHTRRLHNACALQARPSCCCNGRPTPVPQHRSPAGADLRRHPGSQGDEAALRGHCHPDH